MHIYIYVHSPTYLCILNVVRILSILCTHVYVYIYTFIDPNSSTLDMSFDLNFRGAERCQSRLQQLVQRDRILLQRQRQRKGQNYDHSQENSNINGSGSNSNSHEYSCSGGGSGQNYEDSQIFTHESDDDDDDSDSTTDGSITAATHTNTHTNTNTHTSNSNSTNTHTNTTSSNSNNNSNTNHRTDFASFLMTQYDINTATSSSSKIQGEIHQPLNSDNITAKNTVTGTSYTSNTNNSNVIDISADDNNNEHSNNSSNNSILLPLSCTSTYSSKGHNSEGQNRKFKFSPDLLLEGEDDW